MTLPLARRPTRSATAVITFTGEGQVVDLNEEAERMFGARRDDALGKPVAHVLSLAGAQAAEFGDALSADPSGLIDRELMLTASLPDDRPFAAELTVARAGTGSPLLIVWIRDVSARRADETESARRFAMLAHGEEIAGIGSWDWDLRTGELRWSDNLFRLLGLHPRSLTPTPEHALERVHEDDRDRVRRSLATVVGTGRVEPLEFNVVQVGGGLRRVQLTGASVAGDARRFLGTVQDVTERRQIAREIAGHIAIEEVLAAWASLEDGAEQLLARLGEAMEFVVAVLWLQRDDVLIPRTVWSSRSTEASEFVAARQPLNARPRQGLAVEAWLSRQPVVVVSLPDAPTFLGRDAAVGAGLRGAVAFPAVSGDLTFAVLEFYSHESLTPTETLLRSLTGMGHELGHFFARRSGELRPHELTAREREILQLAAQGMSTKTIAHHLTLSPLTVKTHFENLYAKWAVPDRASAVAKALREGFFQ
jgi:PAS domain S-box-containing protein